jgi:hypothetical protein
MTLRIDSARPRGAIFAGAIVITVAIATAPLACGSDVETNGGGAGGHRTSSGPGATSGHGGSGATGGGGATGSGVGTGGGSATGTGVTTGAAGGNPSTGTGSGAGGGVPVDCSAGPNECPDGTKCVCGGPGNAICECGAPCTTDSDCPTPAQPVCCKTSSTMPGTCTSACACYCD